MKRGDAAQRLLKKYLKIYIYNVKSFKFIPTI
jgi:hypothetical protein